MRNYCCLINDIAWAASFHRRKCRLYGFKCCFAWCNFIPMKQVTLSAFLGICFLKHSSLGLSLCNIRLQLDFCFSLLDSQFFDFKVMQFLKSSAVASNAVLLAADLAFALAVPLVQDNRWHKEQVTQSSIIHRILGANISTLRCQQPLSVWFHDS